MVSILLVLAIAATACGSSTDATEEDVIGAWELEGLAVDGFAVPMAQDLATSTIRLLDGERVEGEAPCNDFAGRWSYDDGLAVSDLTLSAVACVDPDGGGRIMAAEEALMGALADTARFEIHRVEDVLQMSSGRYLLTWRLEQS